MASPFDFVTAAGQTKEDLFETRGVAEKDYLPFLVNRAFSYHLDTLGYANYANQNFGMVPPKSQFHFYLHALDKKKRFSKWSKPEEDENLDLVMKHFNYNIEKAKATLQILSADDLALLHRVYELGGKTHE